jgi:hypothetical protein
MRFNLTKICKTNNSITIVKPVQFHCHDVEISDQIHPNVCQDVNHKFLTTLPNIRYANRVDLNQVNSSQLILFSPLPHGLSQNGSPAFDAFHSAKSVGFRLSYNETFKQFDSFS